MVNALTELDAAFEAELERALNLSLKTIAQQTGKGSVAQLAKSITTETHVFEADCDLTLVNHVEEERTTTSGATVGTRAQALSIQAEQFDALVQTPWHLRIFKGYDSIEQLSGDTCVTCLGQGQVTCHTCSGTTTVKCPAYDCYGGRVACGNCTDGSATCGQCNGNRTTIQYETVRWTKPNGEFGADHKQKTVTCYNCNGTGKSGTCPKCRGLAKVDCRTCNGRSKVTCSGCSGTGKIRCGDCVSGTVYHRITSRPRIDRSTAYITPDIQRFDMLRGAAPGFLSHPDACDPRDFKGQRAGTKGKATYSARAHAALLVDDGQIAVALGSPNHDPAVSAAFRQKAATPVFAHLKSRAFDALAKTPLGKACLNILSGDPSDEDRELFRYYDTNGQAEAEITLARSELEKSISSGVVGMRIGVLFMAFVMPFVIYERGFLAMMLDAGLTDWRPFLTASFALPMLAVLFCYMIFRNRRRRMVRNTGLGAFKGHTLKLPRLMFFAVLFAFLSHQITILGYSTKLAAMPQVQALGINLDYPAACNEVSASEIVPCMYEVTVGIAFTAFTGPLGIDELMEP